SELRPSQCWTDAWRAVARARYWDLLLGPGRRARPNGDNGQLTAFGKNRRWCRHRAMPQRGLHEMDRIPAVQSVGGAREIPAVLAIETESGLQFQRRARRLPR